MFPFRPSFLYVVLAFFFFLGAVLPSISAAPQFGRPLLHVYGEKAPALFTPPGYVSSTQSASATGMAQPTSTANSSAVASGNPDSDVSDNSDATNSTEAPLASGTPIQTSGALPSQAVHITNIALGSVVATAIYFFI